TPFLLQSMHFTQAEVGVANKVLGLWFSIGGALLGGALMLRIGLWWALLGFGILQMLSNLGFWWLAVNGQGVMPGLMLPAFGWLMFFIVSTFTALPALLMLWGLRAPVRALEVDPNAKPLDD